MTEVWRDIPGYEGLYQVSNLGRVKSLARKMHEMQNGTPTPSNLPIINHKDENKGNNNVKNLEWCTQIYNANYGTAIKRRTETAISKQNKAVYQMNMNGEILAIFPSVKEATRVTGINNISAAARGILRQSKGYKWMYANINSQRT